MLFRKEEFFRLKCCNSFILIQKAFVAFFLPSQDMCCFVAVWCLVYLYFSGLSYHQRPHTLPFPRDLPRCGCRVARKDFLKRNMVRKINQTLGGEDVITGERPTSRSARRHTYFKSISPQKFLSHFSISIWC